MSCHRSQGEGILQLSTKRQTRREAGAQSLRASLIQEAAGLPKGGFLVHSARSSAERRRKKTYDRAAFLVAALTPLAVLFGATPKRAGASHVNYSVRNATRDRSLNATKTTVKELANVLSTHLADHNAGRLH